MTVRIVEIANRRIGTGELTFITMEAGPTHDGVDSAIRLADSVAASGADAIKFQIIDPDRLVSDRTIEMSYEVLVDRDTGATETKTEPVYDMLSRRALDHKEWRIVKQHCDQVGLAFFATIGFPDEVDFLQDIGCQSIKIASADIDHFPLIRHAAKSGISIQIDTGHATIGEVEAAVDVIRSEDNENIIIHHCPSGYPARLTGINLNIIKSLKQMFAYPIAFSDHSPGWEMDIAAVALGADLVEKTITQDRTTPSIEHIMSIEPHETKEFVDTIRGLSVAFGTNRRLLEGDEREKRAANRRSICTSRPITSGKVITLDDVDFRRPGFGLRPSEVNHVVGRLAARDLEAGETLCWSDLGTHSPAS